MLSLIIQNLREQAILKSNVTDLLLFCPRRCLLFPLKSIQLIFLPALKKQKTKQLLSLQDQDRRKVTHPQVFFFSKPLNDMLINTVIRSIHNEKQTLLRSDEAKKRL